MKSTLLLCVALAALTGCSELSCGQREHYGDYGVPGPVYAKIQHRQRLDLQDIIELSHDQVHGSDIMTYLAYSNTEIPLTDQDAEWLAREKVSGDVITYLKENPNHTGGLLSIFSLSDY